MAAAPPSSLPGKVLLGEEKLDSLSVGWESRQQGGQGNTTLAGCLKVGAVVFSEGCTAQYAALNGINWSLGACLFPHAKVTLS